MTDTNRIHTDALAAARKDPRIVIIVVYADGWVPNSYTYPARGKSYFWSRPPVGGVTPRRWKCSQGVYDRKRSYGEGPRWVAISSRNGRLASG